MERHSCAEGVADAVGDGLTGGVVGVPELGLGVALVIGDDVALLVGLGLGLDVEPESVLLDAVGLGDAVAVSATTAALRGSNESACAPNWSRAWPPWAAVT